MNNPKLAPGRTSWYRYYAGFSLEFARDIVTSLELPQTAHVLDPWSGSGTTVLAFAEARIKATGIDANPALVVVGRGRLLPSEVRESLLPIADGILELARNSTFSLTAEPLTTWFDRPSANRLRRVEWAIQHLLVSHSDYRPLASAPDLVGMSSLAAFYYVALFEIVRDLAKKFRATNPTWVKVGIEGELVRSTWVDISRQFLATAARLAGALPNSTDGTARALVRLGNSTALPVKNGSVDAVVTSPPYCTRLDYVVSTLPELAVLGYSRDATRKLRDEMIGTPTISPLQVEEADEWGPDVARLLAAIGSHEAKASATYYLKTYRQYFDGISHSLAEIDRVLRRNGKVVIVAQDSSYKDIHVDLPGLITSMALTRGWTLSARTDFTTGRGWARVNPSSRRYTSRSASLEAVLVLTVN